MREKLLVDLKVVRHQSVIKSTPESGLVGNIADIYRYFFVAVISAVRENQGLYDYYL